MQDLATSTHCITGDFSGFVETTVCKMTFKPPLWHRKAMSLRGFEKLDFEAGGQGDQALEKGSSKITDSPSLEIFN